MGEAIIAKEAGLKSLQLQNLYLNDDSLSNSLSQYGHNDQIGQLTKLQVFQCSFILTDWR